MVKDKATIIKDQESIGNIQITGTEYNDANENGVMKIFFKEGGWLYFKPKPEDKRVFEIFNIIDKISFCSICYKNKYERDREMNKTQKRINERIEYWTNCLKTMDKLDSQTRFVIECRIDECEECLKKEQNIDLSQRNEQAKLGALKSKSNKRDGSSADTNTRAISQIHSSTSGWLR